ncbi:MAG: helix-turn-helix domain-containing protein [Chloroflexota bacterium]
MDGPAIQRGTPQRRLTLTPIAFDLILALSQVRGGLRLSDLAHIVGAPVSSVQASLRILLANGIVDRLGDDRVVYRLRPGHPAQAALVDVAAVLAEPEHVIGIVLRANPSVSFASIDRQGFVFATSDDADAADMSRLDRAIGAVRAARNAAPALMQLRGAEFGRLARVDVGLVARLVSAVRLKGHLPITHSPSISG